VFDRIAQGVDGYSPYTLPLELIVNFTSRRDWAHLDPSQIQTVLSANSSRLSAAVAEAQRVITYGIRAYWLFVVGALLAVRGLWQIATTGSGWTLGIAGLAIGIVAAIWSVRTDRRMDAIFSSVWHQMRPELRSALARRPGGAAIVAALPQVSGTAVGVAGISSPVV
jgi:hypothetical protein